MRGISFGIPVVPPESWKTAGSAGSIAIAARLAGERRCGPLDLRREIDETRTRFAQHERVHERRVCLPDPLDHVQVVEVTRPVGRHDRRRARELGELRDLGEAVGDERRDRDRPDLLQREVEDDELGDVRELHDDAVERPQPAFEEVQREVRRLAVDVGVA